VFTRGGGSAATSRASEEESGGSARRTAEARLRAASATPAEYPPPAIEFERPGCLGAELFAAVTLVSPGGHGHTVRVSCEMCVPVEVADGAGWCARHGFRCASHDSSHSIEHSRQRSDSQKKKSDRCATINSRRPEHRLVLPQCDVDYCAGDARWASRATACSGRRDVSPGSVHRRITRGPRRASARITPRASLASSPTGESSADFEPVRSVRRSPNSGSLAANAMPGDPPPIICEQLTFDASSAPTSSMRKNGENANT